MFSPQEKAVLQPYFDAVKSILGGQPIENLNGLIDECNAKYHQVFKPEVSQKPKFNPALAVLTFGADAENRILQGEDPEEVYKILLRKDGENIDQLRENVRSIVADNIK